MEILITGGAGYIGSHTLVEVVRDGLAEVVSWGSGTPRRAFLLVDYMAAASLFVLSLPEGTYRKNTDLMLAILTLPLVRMLPSLSLPILLPGRLVLRERSAPTPRNLTELCASS